MNVDITSSGAGICFVDISFGYCDNVQHSSIIWSVCMCVYVCTCMYGRLILKIIIFRNVVCVPSVLWLPTVYWSKLAVAPIPMDDVHISVRWCTLVPLRFFLSRVALCTRANIPVWSLHPRPRTRTDAFLTSLHLSNSGQEWCTMHRRHRPEFLTNYVEC